MKIVYILHSSNPHQGSTKSFLTLLNGMVQKGVQPLVVLPNADGIYQELQRKEIPTKVLVYRTATYPPTSTIKDLLLFIPRLLGRWGANIVASYQLVHVARTFGANLIHTNVSIISIGYHASRWLRIPHIWHIREYAKQINLHHYLCQETFLKKLHQPHSYSICITKDLLHHYGLQNESNAYVVYNGILSKYDVRFTEEKQPFFFYAGRLEKVKGIIDLLDAFHAFHVLRPNSPLRLTIAGTTPNKAFIDLLYTKVQEVDLQDYIDFLGEQKDIDDFMYKAYSTIVPSISEGFGRVMPEAMFNGSLVVGHNVAGMKEQFDNGAEMMGQEIGLRYNTKQELVQLMCDIADNGIEYYYSMIGHSQQVVTTLYSIEKNIDSLYCLYNKILQD